MFGMKFVRYPASIKYLCYPYLITTFKILYIEYRLISWIFEFSCSLISCQHGPWESPISRAQGENDKCKMLKSNNSLFLSAEPAFLKLWVENQHEFPFHSQRQCNSAHRWIHLSDETEKQWPLLVCSAQIMFTELLPLLTNPDLETRTRSVAQVSLNVTSFNVPIMFLIYDVKGIYCIIVRSRSRPHVENLSDQQL